MRSAETAPASVDRNHVDVSAVLSMAPASTGSAHALPKPAEISHQLWQRESSSAYDGGSGGAAEHSPSQQEQAGSASSRRFTPAQQAVATALMTVANCAMNDSVEAALAAREILIMNNPYTQPLLDLLLNNVGAYTLTLPTMQMVKQLACDEVEESLAALAMQCEAAQCHPLEVFTRSLQRSTRKALLNRHNADPAEYERQRQQQLQHTMLPPTLHQDDLQALQKLGVQPSVTALVVTVLEVYDWMLRTNGNGDRSMAWAYFTHMFPGTEDALTGLAGEDLSPIQMVTKLAPSFTSALHTYRHRAAESGQTFEHVVMLEAVVQGWSLITGKANEVLVAMLAAEPAVASTGTSIHQDQNKTHPCPAAVATAEEAPGEGPIAASASTHCPSSTARPREPEQACLATLPEQQAPAAVSERAIATVVSPGGAAEGATAAEACHALRPHQVELAEALLAVFRQTLKDGQEVGRGSDAVQCAKLILASNTPIIRDFLWELIPEKGQLPSLEQLAASASPSAQEALHLLSEHIVAAGWQPLEFVSRSAHCPEHLQALWSKLDGGGWLEARLQRLQAIVASLASGSAAESRDAQISEGLFDRVEMLSSHHGIAFAMLDLIHAILKDVIIFLEADSLPRLKASYTEGAHTSYTICIDHMLPGVLDGVLEHEGNDLTSLDALLKMVPPLEIALQAYRDRAVAAGKSTAQMVMLEAAVQGWPFLAPYLTKLPNKIIAALAANPNAIQEVPSNGALPASPAASNIAEAQSDQMPLAAGVNAGARSPVVKVQNRPTSASLTGSEAGRGHLTEEPLEKASADGSAAGSDCKAAENTKLSEVEKAERKKAKKARQRAARAQAATQAAEASSTASKEPGIADSRGSASKQERSAETQAVQPLEALQVTIDAMPATPESEPNTKLSSYLSEDATDSRGSSLSPQPSLQLHPAASPGHQEPVLPSSAAQEEEPWQEVKTSRRKPVSQQVASKACARKARKQHRRAPGGLALATATLRATELQRVDTAVARPHAPAGAVAAEQLPHWLSVLSVDQRQQPSQRERLDSLQTFQPQAPPSRTQHELLHTVLDDTAPDVAALASEPMPQPGLRFEGLSSEQAATADLPEEDDQQDDNLCIVCWEQLREIIFYQCMHMCTCKGCAQDIMAAGALCPMCRTRIQQTIIARF